MARVNIGLVGLVLLAIAYYGTTLFRHSSSEPVAHQASRSSTGEWLTSESEALKLARERNLPLIVDFTAEWCGACHELDVQVFNHPSVSPILHSAFVTLRIDVTDDNEENQRLLMKYGVMGLPAVIFVDSQGKVLEEPRIHGLIPPEKFLADIQRFIPKPE